MPYVRFNLEGTPTERPVRLSTEIDEGLIKLTMTRNHSDRMVLTMTRDQAVSLIRLLRNTLDAPHPHPHHRP